MSQAIHVNDSTIEQCMENCHSCHDECARTIQHCLSKGGAHAGVEHIRLLTDCVQICQTSHDFMLRGSSLHKLTCRACAEICSRCAEDCARLSKGDSRMDLCAEACRKCAES